MIRFQEILLLCGMSLWLGTGMAVTLSAQEASDQARNSIGRLQTWDSSPAPSQRDEDINQLLPNFRVLRNGTSDREWKESGLQRLQQIRLTSSGRKTAQKVCDEMSLYRHLPEVRFEIDPETYDYFIGNPDLVVSMWQAMGISAIGLKQVSQYQYQMNNTDGTDCKFFYLKRSQNANVVYCQGKFQSPVLKNPIEAEGVVCVYTKFEKHPDGTTFALHSADAFIAFENGAIETAAKLTSPISNYIADRNFQEISLFMHSMHLSMARQPSWVQELTGRIEPVMPERAQEFDQLTLEVYKRNQARLAQSLDEREDPVLIR
ncbi:MAG: hypothetical protein KDA78_05025 [Planctomycetaceae bacterium]|nr:hypothetical protein [Planctomycetaceae bacterium]